MWQNMFGMKSKVKDKRPYQTYPFFFKVIIEYFSLFYEFIQVPGMFFLSRNNAVEHIAVEHTFAFTLASDNYCFKYKG